MSAPKRPVHSPTTDAQIVRPEGSGGRERTRASSDGAIHQEDTEPSSPLRNLAVDHVCPRARKLFVPIRPRHIIETGPVP